MKEVKYLEVGPGPDYWWPSENPPYPLDGTPEFTVGHLLRPLAGLALSATGYVAGAEQSEEAKLAIRILMSGIPLLCYGAGTWVFRRFGLTREVHADMRRELDARALSRRARGLGA